MGTGCHNGRQIATFIESNFCNLKSIELKFISIVHHLKNIFKNVDTIIFNTCQNVTDFCYHDDCLRHCERLRCLRYYQFRTSEDDVCNFNAIMKQHYSGLEKVHFDIRYTTKMMENWEGFIQRNTNIKSISMRFSNENESTILKVIKTVVVCNAINLQQLYLQIDLDAAFHDVFNFGIIHEQLVALEQREHFDYLGIRLGDHSYNKIKNLNLCESLKSLKMLDIDATTDRCNILPEISTYCNNVKVLTLYTIPRIPHLGDHKTLENTWTYQFANLEELHLRQVKCAFFLIPFFIRHSPKLKKIVTRDCRIVLEKNIEMSMKKFNDERNKICSSDKALIISSNQPNIQSNFEFNLVKLRHVDFEDFPFNEFSPFECSLEDKIGLSVFNSNEDEIRLRKMLESNFN